MNWFLGDNLGILRWMGGFRVQVILITSHEVRLHILIDNEI